ncbi:MAG: hypothetical protein FWC60_09420 [Firmicutes bacterium]|nr:hypothetical protein [Bacillota bacterium]
MPNNQNPFHSPLLAVILLLLAGGGEDSHERINSMSRMIASLQETFRSINTGIETFHAEVVPMFQKRLPSGNEEEYDEDE